MTLQFRTALRLDHRAIDAPVKTYKMKSCLPWQIMVRDQITSVKEHNKCLSILVAETEDISNKEHISLLSFNTILLPTIELMDAF